MIGNSFIHLFIHSFTHSFIYSFSYSSIHSFIHSFIHSLTHSFIHLFIQPLVEHSNGGTGGRGRYCKRISSRGGKFNSEWCGSNGAGRRAGDGPRGYIGDSGSSKAIVFFFFFFFLFSFYRLVTNPAFDQSKRRRSWLQVHLTKLFFITK